jgi:peptidoglycan glycosyltransferase
MNVGARRVGYGLIALMIVLVGQLTYLQVVHADALNHRPDNARLALVRLRRDRGRIVTADGVVIAYSTPTNDDYRFQRHYPHGPEYAQITGFQSIVYGATGVEAAYDAPLTGEDVRFQLGNLSTLFNGKSAQSLLLTVNSAAQNIAMQALGNRRGSVVVLDTETGGIVAMYSNPTFDPNLLSIHNPQALQSIYTYLTHRPDNPMLARAFRELYPPGSTFKVATSAVALDHGAVTPTTPQFPFLTNIPLPLTNGQTLANFGGERCGGTLTDAFTVSCNTTFAAIGQQLGDTLAEGFDQFGLNEKPPPIDASPGAVGSQGPAIGAFKNDVPGFMKAAIGQGEVAVTPLEMALIAESVARGGTMLVPHFVQQVRAADGRVVKTIAPQVWRTVMTPQTAATIKGFMLNVVNDPRGTGTAAQIPGIQVAGKTGTAQTAPGVAPHAWFVAFAPADAPRYAIAVLVEHGGEMANEATGGRVAAPIARQILARLLGVG